MRLLRDVLIDVYGLEAEVTGWNLSSAQSISDDSSVIVGWGINPSSSGTAWMAKIPELLDPVPRRLRRRQAIDRCRH